ncbi:MAG: hypothetical protein AW08_02321 [Candidatus Accumulibacter adjunctus]|uniref:Uncharacterized protein n=1 Tax=Candidatus Accumulibacter adjunctus TaxID=1454001 RepID=A0A011MAH0_9PROT|nr:MAG: hypothetical protein AW08_02321 [Candidatus Accumulibacter adjunctus]
MPTNSRRQASGIRRGLPERPVLLDPLTERERIFHRPSARVTRRFARTGSCVVTQLRVAVMTQQLLPCAPSAPASPTLTGTNGGRREASWSLNGHCADCQSLRAALGQSSGKSSRELRREQRPGRIGSGGRRTRAAIQGRRRAVGAAPDRREFLSSLGEWSKAVVATSRNGRSLRAPDRGARSPEPRRTPGADRADVRQLQRQFARLPEPPSSDTRFASARCTAG